MEGGGCPWPGDPRGRIGKILNRVFSSDGGWAIGRSSAQGVARSLATSGPAVEGGVCGEGRPQPQVCAEGPCAFESPSRTVFCRHQRLRPGLPSSPAQPMPWAPDPLWLFQGQEAGPPQPRPLRWRGVASGVWWSTEGGASSGPRPRPPPKRALGRRRGTALLGRARV